MVSAQPRFMGTTSVPNEDVQKTSYWIHKINDVMNDLLMDLSSTAKAWEYFRLRCDVYFDDMPLSSKAHTLLASIQVSFDDLEFQKTKLEYLMKRCDGFGKDVSILLLSSIGS